MKALILAGGLGTRLRPLTETRPKHLLPIANRPHIEHVFDLLQRHGINDVVLLTSYLAEHFEDAIRHASERGIELSVTHEAEPLGTAGALKNAEATLDDETFLAFNGDILTDVDLTALIDLHRGRGAEGTILLTPVDDPSAFGVVPTDPEGRVQAFVEKPESGTAPTNLINAGVYVLEPSVLDRVPEGRVWSAEHQLFPGLVAEKAPLFAMALEAYWMDIGTPQKYLQANLDALSGAYRTTAVPNPSPEAVVVGEDARVPEFGLASVCVGEGAVVEIGARVERSVLLPRSTVGADAVVTDSILGEGAKVAPGARLAGGVLADGEASEA